MGSGAFGESGFGFEALGSGADAYGSSFNVAIGDDALFHNATGDANTAIGYAALVDNTSGEFNIAIGESALLQSTTGSANLAIGDSALSSNTTGQSNIAVGVSAGFNLTTGSNNIDIGNYGVAGESNVIRIGTEPTSTDNGLATQTSTFIAGIYGSALPLPLGPRFVFVDSKGQLGTSSALPPLPIGPLLSSARYKRDIHDMGDASDGLLKLRPVSFRYKQDPAGALEYGLIAEEVERVYPELVTHDADGRVEAVHYEMLPALLVNEVQKLARENHRLVEQVAALKKKDVQIDALTERMNALERQVRSARPEHLASAMR
jgi:hypothetical protein